MFNNFTPPILTTITSSSTRHLRANTISPSSYANEDPIPPWQKTRRSTALSSTPAFSTANGFPTQFNFNAMAAQAYGSGNANDAATDEGYDEQKFETPSYMMSWSEEQRAAYRIQARCIPNILQRSALLLPYELAIHILTFTDAHTLSRVALVSKQWHKISEDQQLWRRFFFREGWTVNRQMMNLYLGSYNRTNSGTEEPVDSMEGIEATGGGELGKGKARGIEMPRIEEDAEGDPSSSSPDNAVPQINTVTSSSMSMPTISFPSPLSASSSASTISTSASTTFVSGPPALSASVPVAPALISTPSPLISTRLRSFRRPSELLLRLRNRNNPHIAATSAAASALPNPQASSSAITPSSQLPVAIPVANRSPPPLPPIPIAPLPPTFPHKHHQNQHGQPFISWKHLYHNRHLIEKHWRDGTYTRREIPAAENVADGHQEGIYCVQFDESKIVSGSRDNTIKIWDITTGRCLRTLSKHAASVLCLQYDDRYIVSGSSDNTMIQWDLATGEVIRTLKGHHESVLNLKLDPNHIVSCSKDRTVKIWSLATGELLRTLQGHRAAVNAVQFQDGLVVSASGDRTIKLWDMVTGACLRTFDSHSRGIACVQFDGRLVVSGSSDKTIKVWDVSTGACVSTLNGHTDLVRTLQFDSGRNRIVSGSYDETLKVWDWKTGRFIVDLKEGHTSRVFKLQFNDTKIVSCSQDQKIIVWDFAGDVDTTAGFAHQARPMARQAVPVLLKAQAEFLDYGNTGMSILELSHRSKDFETLVNKAKEDLTHLLSIPDNYDILFMQGGGTTQFSAVVYNLLAAHRKLHPSAPANPLVDYLITGSWSAKAAEEAARLGANVNIVINTKKLRGAYTSVPPASEWRLSGPDAAYVYYCDNETVDGVEFSTVPDIDPAVPLVVDMSSNILSRRVDVARFGVIYAGAQKNIGPAGVTVVIIRRDLLVGPNSAASPEGAPLRPLMLDYKTHADHNSLYNTPPMFGIYISKLVFEWLKEYGGVTRMEETNRRKARRLYETIDRSAIYKSVVERESRSRMNVTFRIYPEALEKEFLKGAEARNYVQLKGHRSVGGIRASIYNAMPLEGVEELVTYMIEFEKANTK
ncbi:pyridoxal phosphate-dependent transferase [Jimgerdemannia flammicorona]|uniref:Phosphoserine aminotransferase n=1 Tax=Jimgerdemannia flammicorona TaxID=994334 RepID=A0A433Q511_9FUNG|nr:pyridoxal phosphate-dependent transferase [Jimgerdemannia flammicorona]